MNRKHVLFALVTAAAALATPNAAPAEPLVRMSLRLTDLAGVDLPHAGDTYVLYSGQTFMAVTSFSLENPNVLASTRASAVSSRPLGLQGMAFDLVSPNSVNAFVPAIDVPGAPPSQLPGQSYQIFNTDGSPFVNLLDIGSDGDLDVAGDGFAVISLTAPTTFNAYQNRFAFGTAGPLDFSGHVYTYGPGFGPDVVLTTRTVALVFDEPTSPPSNPAFLSVGPAPVIEAAIRVVLPEPATAAMWFAAPFVVPGRRRK